MAEAANIPEWWMPAAWPLFWRRAFLITIPISGPLWLAAVIIGGTTAGIFMCGIGIPIIIWSCLKEALWDRQPNEPRR